MNLTGHKFAQLSITNAPGQEGRQGPVPHNLEMRGEHLMCVPVDFSHGDVNETAFEPSPGALEEFMAGVGLGTSQAYTEYRGSREVREDLARKLGGFTGRPISGDDELIITPGSQSALFVAVAAVVSPGDKVAIVEPDYFANRRLVTFMGADVVPIALDYIKNAQLAGLDLDRLESAFKAGASVFLLSNPNNPSGVIYSQAEIDQIGALANRFGVTVIVDQLYCRLLYRGRAYVHLRASTIDPANVITIMGPSKTESLSGYRLGAAFGPAPVIDRMEQVQAITPLRAPGYCQAVLRRWFLEPEVWLADRIARHQAIRDDLVAILKTTADIAVRPTEAGSYLFPRLPRLSVSPLEFVRILRYQAGVTVTPGTEFSPHAHDSVRLNFSQNHEAAVDAVNRLVVLVDRYRAS